MKTPTFRASLFLPIACLVLLAVPANAGNPLTSIGDGLKKVGSALIPFKKAAPPPKALPPIKAAPAPVKKQPKTVKAAAPVKKKASPKTYTSGAAQRKTEAAAAGQKTKPGSPESEPSQPSPALPTAPDTDTLPASTPVSATPEAVSDAPPTGAEVDATTGAPPKSKEIPFGTPVMGRKGFVHSPWAKDQVMVDVTGIAAGAKVKCPFSGKVFRVP